MVLLSAPPAQAAVIFDFTGRCTATTSLCGPGPLTVADVVTAELRFNDSTTIAPGLTFDEADAEFLSIVFPLGTVSGPVLSIQGTFGVFGGRDTIDVINAFFFDPPSFSFPDGSYNADADLRVVTPTGTPDEHHFAQGTFEGTDTLDAAWFRRASIPEPTTLLLLGLGLAGLGFARRHLH